MVVSPSCQQLTGLLSNTVPGLVNGSQGSPAHFREASAVEEVVTCHTPALGPSLTQTAPEPLPEPFIALCQAVLTTWASSQSHLWATLPSENECGESYC